MATILITGASSGIGNLAARALADHGHVVYASMRDLEGRNASPASELVDFATGTAGDIRPLELDVLRQESANGAITAILAEQPALDVVVHNAGHLVVGQAEAFSPEEMARLYDTNVLGAQRVNRAALPHLRAQHSGLLIWVSSTTFRGGHPPFMGPYVASKAAGDLLAQTYAYELIRFGIETSIVVPGAFTTGTSHFPHAGHPADEATTAAYERYRELRESLAERLAAITPAGAHPRAVGEEIARIVDLPAGQRPFRSVVDPTDDGARAVTEVAERARWDFARRIGIDDLLPTVSGVHATSDTATHPNRRIEHA